VSSVAKGLTVAEIAQHPEVPVPDALVQVVALDGPAGTGKSTVSRELARALGWRFVDTGATYRAATLAVVRAGIDPRDGDKVLAIVEEARIVLITDPGSPSVQLDDEDVSAQIRTEQVTSQVSAVSALPAVRQLLIAVQREAIGLAGAVVEGRDIATVVAPRAGLKVYLDARPEVRAARRAGDVLAPPSAHVSGIPVVQAAAGSGSETHTDVVGRALALRDSLDNQTNKLQVSEGAVHLDTSDLSLDQVVGVLLGLVSEAGLTGPGPRA
jgi:cytidylate kinase